MITKDKRGAMLWLVLCVFGMASGRQIETAQPEIDYTCFTHDQCLDAKEYAETYGVTYCCEPGHFLSLRIQHPERGFGEWSFSSFSASVSHVGPEASPAEYSDRDNEGNFDNNGEIYDQDDVTDYWYEPVGDDVSVDSARHDPFWISKMYDVSGADAIVKDRKDLDMDGIYSIRNKREIPLAFDASRQHFGELSSEQVPRAALGVEENKNTVQATMWNDGQTLPDLRTKAGFESTVDSGNLDKQQGHLNFLNPAGAAAFDTRDENEIPNPKSLGRLTSDPHLLNTLRTKTGENREFRNPTEHGKTDDEDWFLAVSDSEHDDRKFGNPSSKQMSDGADRDERAWGQSITAGQVWKSETDSVSPPQTFFRDPYRNDDNTIRIRDDFPHRQASVHSPVSANQMSNLPAVSTATPPTPATTNITPVWNRKAGFPDTESNLLRTPGMKVTCTCREKSDVENFSIFDKLFSSLGKMLSTPARQDQR